MSSGEGTSMWMESKHIYVGETRIVTTRNEEQNLDTAYQERNQFFYHSDHLGSAQLVTDYNGRTYERIEYTPYGESWIEWKDYSDNNYVTPFRFTSKERDMETGLYYYGARYLDAKTSRWMSADPALGEYIPGAPINDEVKKQNQNLPGMGGVFNYVNMHLYHYAGNNPIKYTDPDGENLESWLYFFTRYSRGEHPSNILNDMYPSPLPPIDVGEFYNKADQSGNPLTFEEALMVEGVVAVHPDKAIYHRQGEGNEYNIKMMFPDGGEAVYDKDGNLVTDPLNLGTKNAGDFSDGLEGTIIHGREDVLPYYENGNTESDKRGIGGFFSRLFLFLNPPKIPEDYYEHWENKGAVFPED